MRMMALVATAGLILGGCAGGSAKPKARTGLVEGKATVVEVNNTLGMAVLTIDGKTTQAYWDTDVVAPFHISAVNAHQTTAAPTQDLANSKDAIQPVKEHVVLPAKPGDTIVFRAMRTGDELFLRAVQVVPN